MRRNGARFGVCTSILVLLLADCGQPEEEGKVVAPSEAEPVVACSDGMETVVSPASVPPDEVGPLFLVFGVAELADGSRIASFDPAFQGAGAEDEFGDPRLAEVALDGTVRRLEVPEVDGEQLSDRSQVLIGDQEGTTYVYDSVSQRIVTRGADGEWRSLIETDRLNVTNYPGVSIGPGGTPYVATAGAVYRISDGQPELVVGDPNYALADWRGEYEPELLGEIAAGRTDRLPAITGFVIGADETVYLSSLRSVYSIGRDGETDVLIDASAEDGVGIGRFRLPPIALPPASADLPLEQPSMKALALDPAGRLVVSDAGGQRLLRLGGDKVSVSERIIAAVTGTNTFAAGGESRLFVYQAGGLACAMEWTA